MSESARTLKGRSELAEPEEAAGLKGAMEAKLKHLEFIQAVISRMAQNSFLFKGWAITIAAGLSAFGAANTKHALVSIALVSTLMFWGLDSYYLWLERRFIELYAVVAGAGEDRIDFLMKIDKTKPVRTWLKTCCRPHLCALYGAIVAVELIGIFVIRKGM